MVTQVDGPQVITEMPFLHSPFSLDSYTAALYSGKHLYLVFSVYLLAIAHLRITFLVAISAFFVQLVSATHIYNCFEQLPLKFK